jgi:hypothetical protein
VVTLSVASGAGANISPPVSFYGLWSGVLTTFLTNLPVNLFWLSLTLYLTGMIVRERLCAIPNSNRVFLGGLLGSVLIITAVGTVVDVAFLYERYGSSYTLTADTYRWTVAAILIFASVYLTTLFVMKMDRLFNFVPAAVMMGANVIWWSVLGGSSSEMYFPFIMGLICLGLSPIPILGLAAWHTRVKRSHQQPM